MRALPRFTGIVATDVAEQHFCRGAQAYVSVGGVPVLDAAYGTDGLGRPMAVTTLHAVYCNTKPLLALAVARSTDQGRLDVDGALGELLPDLRSTSLAAVRLRDLLTHSAGIPQLSAVEMAFQTAAGRHETVLALGAQPLDPPHLFYSEFVNWHLLGLAVEAAWDEPATDVVRREVLAPLGLTEDFFLGMTDCEYDATIERLGVHLDLRTRPGVPMLLERTRRVCTEGVVAHGGYASMRALGRLYEQLLAARAGEGPFLRRATAESFTSAQVPAGFDAAMGRTCRYGFGFMVELGGHSFGRRCGPTSFGHTGISGSSFAFADPEHDLVVAVLYNGVVDAATAVDYRRPALVDAVYRDLV